MSKWDNRRILREKNTKILLDNNINFESFNSGAHLRINGHIDFYPGTELWKDSMIGLQGTSIEELIKYLNTCSVGGVSDSNYLSVEQIFNIAKTNKSQNLYDICEAIHKEIYGQKTNN